jgi:hypothetical protein
MYICEKCSALCFKHKNWTKIKIKVQNKVNDKVELDKISLIHKIKNYIEVDKINNK